MAYTMASRTTAVVLFSKWWEGVYLGRATTNNTAQYQHKLKEISSKDPTYAAKRRPSHTEDPAAFDFAFARWRWFDLYDFRPLDLPEFILRLSPFSLFSVIHFLDSDP